MAGYVEHGAVRTWYDERGEGDPLVLLHGGAVDSRFFDKNIDPLAERFHVLAPDRRGHGRTPDVEGPITYDLMAQDTIEFLEAVVDGPAHLVGHSDGALAALLVALRRRDLMRPSSSSVEAFTRTAWCQEPTRSTSTRWSSSSGRATARCHPTVKTTSRW